MGETTKPPDKPPEAAEGALTLAMAQDAIEAAIAEAATLGISQNVAVVDAAGDLIAFVREDRAFHAGIYGAIGKAVASALFGKSSFALEQNPNNTEIGVALAAKVDGWKPIYRQGAVPIILDGVAIGAIGCGGGSAVEDEQCATAGATVVK